MKTLKILSNSHGLTLVELMIVMVLSLLLMGAAYLAYQTQYTSSTVQHQIAQIQQDLRAAMDIIAMDIRNAGAQSATTNNNILPVEASTVDSTGLDNITLMMDLGDGAGGEPNDSIAEGNEHVFYYLTGQDLVRIDYNGVGRQTIAQNVQSFRLQYYSYDETAGSAEIPLASLPGREDEIDYIDVGMTMRSKNPDPDTGQYITRTLNRRIKLRNSGL